MSSVKRWHVGEIVDPDGTGLVMDTCEPVTAPGPFCAAISRQGTPLDFFLTSFNAPIAANTLAAAIRAVVGSDVQYIPIHIQGHGTMTALNALKRVQCVNERRSSFVKWTIDDGRPDRLGGYRQIGNLVLDQVSIPRNAHFFRVHGWEVALVISETAKRAMEESGCFGAKFVELDT
jgi:hypothetical protein